MRNFKDMRRPWWLWTWGDAADAGADGSRPAWRTSLMGKLTLLITLASVGLVAVLLAASSAYWRYILRERIASDPAINVGWDSVPTGSRRVPTSLFVLDRRITTPDSN
jgi:hypothetical protein